MLFSTVEVKIKVTKTVKTILPGKLNNSINSRTNNNAIIVINEDRVIN